MQHFRGKLLGLINKDKCTKQQIYTNEDT